MAARLAEKNGYSNVKVFHAGTPEWSKAGLPLLTSPQFVSERLGYLVLIDARGPEAAKKGQILGAVALSLDSLAQEKEQFPLDRKAYLVLYGQDTGLDKLAPAVKLISSWGYSHVSVLAGGWQGWLASKGPTQTDQVRTKIVYLPRPLPGEINGDEFMNVVNNRPPDKLVLDVRSPDETTGGSLPGALSIPVDSLAGRLAELPKDKEIILHCRTGARAQMGYNILKDAGFKARYLNDKVEVLEQRVFCCFR
ncbi:MAG: rhodanese-like domain-containing protein [Pseudomonadota bacterium]